MGAKLCGARLKDKTFTEENNMARVYNFSAGPSMLPEDVLKTAAAEMMEYGEDGSVGYGDVPPLKGISGNIRRDGEKPP